MPKTRMLRPLRFACLLAALVPTLAGAKVINVEFKFTPFTGDTKNDTVDAVPGLVRVFVNDVPFSEQPVQSQPQMQPNLGAMFSQFAGQNQQAGPSTQSYDDPERKRVRDSGQYDDPYDNQWSRGKRTKANDSKPVSPDHSLCFAQFKEMLIWITVQGRTRSLPVLEGGQVPEGRQLHLQTRFLNSFRRYQPDHNLVLQ